MPKWTEAELDWAYFISKTTLEMQRVKRRVPVGALIMEKEKEEDEETGQSWISTYYAIAKESGLHYLPGKTQATEYVAKLLLQFMKDRGKMPPNTTIEQIYKNGNAKLRYSPSQYDSFSIRLTPQEVGKNVERFLQTLGQQPETRFTPSEVWKVEPAKSSRSKCRTCGSNIEKGRLRLGEPGYFQDHLTYKWHHFDCKADEIWGIPKDMLDGVDGLEDEDIERVEGRIWS
ncbi:MAG: PARP-type zinc finger-containing protein [Candidatus Thorarchaeota archaeon]